MKSALLELEVNDVKTALELIDKAITIYPSFAKYYMIAGQACDGELNDQGRAREYYQKGLKMCPLSVPLWKLIIKLEEKSKGCNKARSMMELARLKLPDNEELYLEAIRLERRAGNDKLAESLMAQALQLCPKSGILWAEEILTCPKTSQKSKSVDALKKCDNDPHVVIAVARLFAADNKGPKARKWFERAVTLDPKLGDAWAYFYAFELKQMVTNNSSSGNDLAEDVLQKCIVAEPNRGELWCGLAKRTENRRLNHEAILKKLTKIILQD
jgi:pre-mRNA-processing factor 6